MVMKFLAASALPDIAAAWARDVRLLAPVREGQAVVYRPWAPDMRPFLGRTPTTSAKEALLPQTEDLLTYAYRKDADDLTRTEVFVAEPLPPEPTLVLGCRPCDARGRALLDRGLVERGAADSLYAAKRGATLFVTVACERMENTCFCHWTGGGPASEDGSDVLLFAVAADGGGHVAKPLTPEGERLLAALPEASAQARDEMADRLARMPEPAPAPDLSGAPEAFLKAFDDLDFWTDQSARCLSCGICTFLCPTCSCFNITDEASGMKGRRIRTWDTCMSALYTLEGSGHNPRPSRAHRLRNRVGHKFCYHPQEYPGQGRGGQPEFSCTGCGRCIKSCPVSVDIRRVVLDILEKGGGQ
jgi:ferredoxin